MLHKEPEYGFTALCLPYPDVFPTVEILTKQWLWQKMPLNCILRNLSSEEKKLQTIKTCWNIHLTLLLHEFIRYVLSSIFRKVRLIRRTTDEDNFL